jgi:outer membrane protein TolC
VDVDVDDSRSLAADQITVELANAREQVQSAQSRFRLETARMKTQLGLPDSLVITLDPVVELSPVQVDADRATAYARELTPRLRQLDISRRESEIDLDETRGENGFELDLEFTYGREMQDPRFRQLWGQPTNPYTVDVNASIPIWDWGERRSRIQAQQISVERTLLRIEQAEAQIASDVLNEVRNVEELQSRALAMRENLGLARNVSRQSLQRFSDGTISALDLLQSLRRETDTALNLLEAYTGWRRALQELQELTYYDFETDQPVLQRFGVTDATGEIVLGAR